jgi:hypothetical protein
MKGKFGQIENRERSNKTKELIEEKRETKKSERNQTQ